MIGKPAATFSFVATFAAGSWVTMNAHVNDPVIGVLYIGLALVAGAIVGHVVGWLLIGYPRWYHMSKAQIGIKDEWDPHRRKRNS
jgi:hypothetical protein